MAKIIYLDMDVNSSKPLKLDPIWEHDDVELIATLTGQDLNLHSETLTGYYSIYKGDGTVNKLDYTHFTILDKNKFCLFLDDEVTQNTGVMMLQILIARDNKHFYTPYIAIPIREGLGH